MITNSPLSLTESSELAALATAPIVYNVEATLEAKQRADAFMAAYMPPK
jgi:hypothetical protein